MFALVTEAFARGQEDGVFQEIDPVHVVSILAGAMIWFVTHAPLLGNGGRASLGPDQYAAFREELLGVAHYLLGTGPDDSSASRS